MRPAPLSCTSQGPSAVCSSASSSARPSPAGRPRRRTGGPNRRWRAGRSRRRWRCRQRHPARPACRARRATGPGARRLPARSPPGRARPASARAAGGSGSARRGGRSRAPRAGGPASRTGSQGNRQSGRRRKWACRTGIDWHGKPRKNGAGSAGTARASARQSPFYVGENAMLRRSNAIAYCTCEQAKLLAANPCAATVRRGRRGCPGRWADVAAHNGIPLTRSWIAGTIGRK